MKYAVYYWNARILIIEVDEFKETIIKLLKNEGLKEVGRKPRKEL